MKKLVILTFIVFSFLLNAQIPTANLEAFYPFNGDYNDASGNSINLNAIGTASPSMDRFGAPGNCYYLDGTISYFEYSSPVIPVSGDFTVNLWVQHNNMQTIAYTLLSQDKAAQTAFYISIDPLASGEIIVGDDWATSVIFPDDNMWHMVSVVKTTDNVHLYIDGQLLASRGAAIGNPDGSFFRIGRKHLTFDEYFEGSVDDVRIYSAALDQTGISAMFYSNPCLRASYVFSGSLEDVSGNGYDFTATSGVSAYTDRFGDANSCYYFNSTGSYMQCNQMVIPSMTPFSVSVWAKHNSIQTGAVTILSQNKSIGSLFTIGKNAIGNIEIGEEWGDIMYPYPDDDQWHMYTVVATTFGTQFYMDGAFVADFGATIMGPDATGFVLGALPSTIDENFQGHIDDVKIYSCELLPNEISDLFHEGNYSLIACMEASYLFEGNTLDNSGNSNDGTGTNLVITEDRLGTVDAAYEFNGFNSKVAIGTTGFDFSNGITFTAWVKPDSKHEAGIIDFMDGGSNGFRLSMGDEVNPVFRAESGTEAGLTSAESFSYYEPGAWYHIAGTFDPTMGDVFIYVNGKLEGMNMAAMTYDFMSTAYIGQKSDGVGNFDGIIDDVKIFNCVLDTNEIQALAFADFFVTLQPQNDTACDMQSFEFMCEAVGQNLTYQWYHNGTPIAGATFNSYDVMMAVGADAGFYYCAITGDLGNITTDVVELVWASPIVTTSVVSGISCWNNCDGIVSANATGGTPSYSYLWDSSTGNQESQEVSGLCGGIYWVTVSDINGCSGSGSITLNEPDALIVDSEIAYSVLCYGGMDGSVVVSASGGIGPYTFDIDGNTQSSGSFTDLYSGTYSVTVVDDNACSVVSTELWVDEPEALSINNVTTQNVYCYGQCTGEIYIDGIGGTAPIEFNAGSGAQGSSTFTDLCAGDYNITITDDNNCQLTHFETVSQVDEIIVSSDYLDVSCFGFMDGAITLNITGGTGPFSYEWYTTDGSGILPGSSEQSNLSAGTYNVVVTDMNLCSASSAFITISEPDILEITETISDAICYGECNGSIELLSSGGTGSFSYTWVGPSFSSNSEDIYDLCVGFYDISVVDENACSVTGSYEISEPIQLLFSSIIPENVSCSGVCDGIITASAYGGTGELTFDIGYGQQASGVFVGLCDTTYNVEVEDENGCSTIGEDVFIYEPEAIVVVETISNNACYGSNEGNIQISVSGGNPDYEFSWTGDSFSSSDQWIFDLFSGTYFLTVTDNNNCSYTNDYIVGGPTEPLAISIINLQNAGCLGVCDGNIHVTGEGGEEPFLYSNNMGSWQSSGNFMNLCPGSYDIFVQDLLGCVVNTGYIDIEETAGFTVNLDILEQAVCGSDNGAAEISITGGSGSFIINWSNGEVGMDADSLPAGMNYVVVSDTIYGCSLTEFFNINNIGAASLSSVITNASCFGSNNGSIDLNITGGVPPFLYEWSNGAITQDIIGLFAGTFEVSVTDNMGCISTGTFTVTKPAPLAISFSKVNATCGSSDGSITAIVSGGTSPYAYNWSSGGNAAIETGLSAGSYSLTVTDNHSCFMSKNVMLSNDGAPIITLDSIFPSTCGGQGAIYVSVTGGSGSYDFSWSNGETTEDLVGFAPGTYELTVEDGTCFAMLEESIPGIVPQKQPICVVTVDTASGTNLVVWEKTEGLGIAYFNVWRETSIPDDYILVGTVAFDDMSEFTDPVANPFTRSWRYKISAVDSCDHESLLSNHHKTIHLTMNVGLGGSYNLIWDDYEGFTFYTYHIHRHTDANGWEFLESLPKTLHSYSNVPPSTEGLWYIVTVDAPFMCSPTSTSKDIGGPYQQSVSNLEDNGISVDIQNIVNTSMSIYPNPNNGLFNLASDDVIKNIRILNVGGKLVQEINTSLNIVEMDIQDVVPGMYIISIKTDKGNAIGKIIKK